MKILSVVGARPNFMKIGPIIAAINQYNENAARQGLNPTPIHHVLVHTGQHYDKMMSETFFQELNLPKPDVFLGIGSGSHAEQIGEIMKKFEGVLLEKKPDVMILVGDVNSTLACALTAAKINYDSGGARPLIAHVEAGLRSFDRSMPEEINRLVTDLLSDFLFTPSEDADRNLLNEGVTPHKIFRVGNVMIDTLLANLDRIRKKSAWKEFGLREHEYALVTLHRPGNVDDPSRLTRIVESLRKLSNGMSVIFPVHPRTKNRMQAFGLWQKAMETPGLILKDPLSYLDIMGLVLSARFVLTDSGGLQEETTYLGIPCLTLRPNTERPVTTSQGTNKLTSLDTLERDIDERVKGRVSGSTPELWDGQTGHRVISILAERIASGKGSSEAAPIGAFAR